MPELPDVETFKNYLESTAMRQPVAHVTVLAERVLRDITPQTLGRRLKGRQFVDTRRHGKYLFARLDRDGWLLLHFGMTGYLKYYAQEREDPNLARVLFDFDNGCRLAFVNPRLLGTVGWVADAGAFLEEAGLGPDALDKRLSRDRLQNILGDRGGSIKAQLMNQDRLAGIGNIYADEILFQAGIHPASRPSALSTDDYQHLHRTMRRVLRLCAQKQVRVDDFPRGYLLPHRRGDRQCPACKGDLQKTAISGRTTWLCPNCQKKRS